LKKPKSIFILFDCIFLKTIDSKCIYNFTWSNLAVNYRTTLQSWLVATGLKMNTFKNEGNVWL